MMIKGCGMGLAMLIGCLSLGVVLANIDPSLIKHQLLMAYCDKIKHERVYKTMDLENSCVMKVAFFDNKRVSAQNS